MNESTLIEWIPNISTAEPEAIGAIQNIFVQIPNLYVLHIDPGPEVNRTVFTLAGNHISLKKALFSLMEWLHQNIDMARHTGAHPRMGALDVSPYVLLKGGEVKELILWVEELAQEMSVTYQLPVFLYEQSAHHVRRSNLADIRRGEYEGLREKMATPEWKPDYGREFNPALGATVMGVRDFLIAYNVNLDTRDVSIPGKIARAIRSKGDPISPYRLPGLKAIGWYLEEEGICQVSTNITATQTTTPLDVFQQVRSLANSNGIRVTGSELIGLIPRHSVIAMQQKEILTTSELAGYLGLDYCGITDIQGRMIEHKVYLASDKFIFKEIFESR